METFSLSFGDRDAEALMLGAMLSGRFDVTSDCLESVEEDYFASEENRDVFRAIKRLTNEGEVAEPFSVVKEMKKMRRQSSARICATSSSRSRKAPTWSNRARRISRRFGPRNSAESF